MGEDVPPRALKLREEVIFSSGFKFNAQMVVANPDRFRVACGTHSIFLGSINFPGIYGESTAITEIVKRAFDGSCATPLPLLPYSISNKLSANFSPADAPFQHSENITPKGKNGVRPIRFLVFRILSDSGSELADNSLGPKSLETRPGVLGSCLTHIYEIQAALTQIPLNALSVDVTGQVDHRSGQEGFEGVLPFPHNIRYALNLKKPVTPEQLAKLPSRVETACPILNLLTHPQHIAGSVVNNGAVVVDRSLVAA